MTLWQFTILALLSGLGCFIAWLIYRACAAMADDLDSYVERPYQ